MFGNAYLEERKNLFDGLLRFKHITLQAKMKQLNDWYGEEVIQFEPYRLEDDN